MVGASKPSFGLLLPAVASAKRVKWANALSVVTAEPT
jgi:hypothetical protein